MSDCPNLEALVQGRVSGRVCEWPALREEVRRVLAEREQMGVLVKAARAVEAALAVSDWRIYEYDD